jgi:hypothetical protein
MNNKFDWNRFCKVVNKDFRNIWHTFGPTMLILAVLPFAVWLFMVVIRTDVDMSPDIRLMMIEGVAYLAALMAPSRMYRTWNLRNEGIYYAMLPASKMEKYCSALLFSLIVCPLMVYVGGMVLDVFLTALPFGPWRDWLWQGEMGFPFTFNLSLFEKMTTDDFGSGLFAYYGSWWVVSCWTGYVATVLMFFFTSTLFKRHKVLQTILWLYVIEFVFSVILIPIFMAIFSNTDAMEWLYDHFYGIDAEVMFNWIFHITNIFNLLLIALFGWLSWRRLNRMAY